jgi:flavodoxin I
MIGYVPADGYDYTDSKSIRDGKFLGLPLDANNEDDMTEERVKQWTQQLVDEGMKA